MSIWLLAVVEAKGKHSIYFNIPGLGVVVRIKLTSIPEELLKSVESGNKRFKLHIPSSVDELLKNSPVITSVIKAWSKADDEV